MMKVTERGVESIGSPRELSKEDLEFIDEMFQDFANYQKHPLDKQDRESDA